MIQHNILFATDLNDRDRTAFLAASKLALKAKSKLLVLHVADSRTNRSTTDREMVMRKLSKYIPNDIAVDFDHLLEFGKPSEKILLTAKEKKIDLLILGTHGREGMGRVFSGSVAEQVIRHSTIPVMTVRNESAQSTHVQPQILVPIDFSVYGYAALEYATKLAISVAGEITIVHVDESDHSATKEFPHGHPSSTEKQKEVWKQLKGYKPSSSMVPFVHKLLKGEPAKEIVDYASQKHFDFIVQGTHGRSGFGRTLMGSVAEKIVRHARCPVISIRPTAKRASILSA